MTLTEIRDETRCRSRIALEFTDEELYRAISPESILAEARTRLARAVVDRIMLRLGPAIDRALSERDDPC